MACGKPLFQRNEAFLLDGADEEILIASPALETSPVPCAPPMSVLQAYRSFSSSA
jgi:hypothetical protein